MNRRMVVLGALLVAGIVVATVVLTDSAAFSIVDEDCPSTVRYGVAVNVIGGLRQDDIALIDREGRMTRLTRDHSSFDPSFSPDGAALAFVAGVGIGEECCGWDRQAIKVMDIDGSTKRKVTDGRHYDSEPAWSPDGDVIAFVRSGVGLMVVPATGGEPRLVQPEEQSSPSGRERSPQFPRFPTWSADGDRLAFVAGGSEPSIYVIDEDGSEPRRIASQLGSVETLAWSPDGKTFAFQGGEGIFTVTLEEPNPRLWEERADAPEFSPNGTHLLYVDGLRSDFDARFTIRPLEGGTPQPLTEKRLLPGFERDADWLECS